MAPHPSHLSSEPRHSHSILRHRFRLARGRMKMQSFSRQETIQGPGCHRSRSAVWHWNHRRSSPKCCYCNIWVMNDDGSNATPDRKSTRLNSSHITISYAVFCLKKKKKKNKKKNYVQN